MDWHRRQRHRIYRGGAQSIHSWYRPLVPRSLFNAAEFGTSETPDRKGEARNGSRFPHAMRSYFPSSSVRLRCSTLTLQGAVTILKRSKNRLIYARAGGTDRSSIFTSCLEVNQVPSVSPITIFTNLVPSGRSVSSPSDIQQMPLPRLVTTLSNFVDQERKPTARQYS